MPPPSDNWGGGCSCGALGASGTAVQHQPWCPLAPNAPEPLLQNAPADPYADLSILRWLGMHDARYVHLGDLMAYLQEKGHPELAADLGATIGLDEPVFESDVEVQATRPGQGHHG